MDNHRLKLYLTDTPKIVPNNAYWRDQLSNPGIKILEFRDAITLEVSYLKAFNGFKIIGDSILIKSSKYVFHNGEHAPVMKKVKCIDTGEVYKSAKHASNEMGISYHMIARVARGTYPQTKGGYKFEYVK